MAERRPSSSGVKNAKSAPRKAAAGNGRSKAAGNGAAETAAKSAAKTATKAPRKPRVRRTRARKSPDGAPPRRPTERRPVGTRIGRVSKKCVTNSWNHGSLLA